MRLEEAWVGLVFLFKHEPSTGAVFGNSIGSCWSRVFSPARYGAWRWSPAQRNREHRRARRDAENTPLRLHAFDRRGLGPFADFASSSPP